MKTSYIKLMLSILLCLLLFPSCKKALDDQGTQSANASLSLDKNTSSSQLHLYGQVNLVADLSSFAPVTVDNNLVNAWGLAFSPHGGIWVGANHTGLSTIYNSTGAILRPPVTIPAFNNIGPGAPTGVAYNTTDDFKLPNCHKKSVFIFASEDGIISAWADGNSAIKVADRSGINAVYKGIALGNDGSHDFIYATDFSNAKIDMFNSNFHFIGNNLFQDPTIPKGFAPFNIQFLEGKFFVTYAKQKPDHHDDQSGPGNGYVNIFSKKGVLLKRFVSNGVLNSPWGIAISEESFCEANQKIYIGNFGDGHINVFDVNGQSDGPLMYKDKASNIKPIEISGLWALSFQPEYVENRDINTLFFTAGPSEEGDGIFGSLHCLPEP